MEHLTRRDFARCLGAGSFISAGAPLFQTSVPPASSSGSLTDVPGLRVGHFTDPRRPTGCTAILFDDPATAGADYDGSAPGELLGVMLQPVSPLDRIHGILLTGGGPMGLGAVAGAVQFLESRGLGYAWGGPNVRVPIVVGAVIDDLAIGDGRIRPDPDAAMQACTAARNGPVAEGSVGAGAGATVGKMFVSRGLPGMKGGIGTASIRDGDLVVAALAVVNAAGDVLDWRSGQIVAGARLADGSGFANSAAQLRTAFGRAARGAAVAIDDRPFHATTLSIIATNVTLDKTRLTKLAMMANTGAARAISPYHTDGDGDQVLAVSTARTSRADLPLTVLGAVAADALSTAIMRGVQTAAGVPGWIGAADLTAAR
jgi:L-aminopeptidase/D-esterase-like protein